jgi:hypothetical protein
MNETQKFELIAIFLVAALVLIIAALADVLRLLRSINDRLEEANEANPNVIAGRERREYDLLQKAFHGEGSSRPDPSGGVRHPRTEEDTTEPRT